MDVGLIACCKTKRPRPCQARELYVSPLFLAARRWISRPGRCDEWAILSAKHGLVDPARVLAPYELDLRRLSEEEKRQWVEQVQLAIRTRWEPTTTRFIAVLGRTYIRALPFPHVVDVIARWTALRRKGILGFIWELVRWLRRCVLIGL